jgi:3-oxoacyl-[acyl-carrier protein] reductase
LREGPFRESEPDAWDPWIRLNLYGVLHCTHAVIGGMSDRGWGRVVTVISDAGRIGERNQAVYSAAKAAAAGFSRALALEVGPDGVTSNCVSLGTVGPVTDPEIVAKMARRYAMRRLGRPSDVAMMVLFLGSEEASWVTGQTIPVNGGYATS